MCSCVVCTCTAPKRLLLLTVISSTRGCCAPSAVPPCSKTSVRVQLRPDATPFLHSLPQESLRRAVLKPGLAAPKHNTKARVLVLSDDVTPEQVNALVINYVHQPVKSSPA